MRYFKHLLLIFLLLPVAYTVSYYFIEIRPHSKDLQEKIDSYDFDSKNYQLIKRMALKVEKKNGIINYVSHSLAVDHIDTNFRDSWHIIGAHWHLWNRVIYSKEELFNLWLSQAPYLKGRGMNEASFFFFNKNFEQLSCYQLAQLTVMVKSPLMFKPESKKSEQRIKRYNLNSECN